MYIAARSVEILRCTFRHTALFLNKYLSNNLPGTSNMATGQQRTNVLVYTGVNNKTLYSNAAYNLLKFLHPDKYIVYELTKAEVLQPWRESVALLVVLSETIDESTAEVFRNYLAKDGKILVSCSNFTVPEIGLSCTTASEGGFIKIKYRSVEDIHVYHGKVSYNFPNAEVLATDSNNTSVVMKACNQGILVVSEVNLVVDTDILLPKNVDSAPSSNESRRQILKSILVDVFGLEACTFTLPDLTPGYVLSKDTAALVELTSKLNIKEIPVEKGEVPLKMPLISGNETIDSLPFDKDAYFSKLNTKSFGQIIVFFPVVTSTMIPAEYLTECEGVVVIAGRQTSGRGRGGNQWISPEGCAMFTLLLSLSLTSQLGERLSILQHMATLAAVSGINKIPGYEKLDLRLKWPNDLYFGKDVKIGGVLVNTTIQGNLVHAFVGIGINVANERPTICINSIIKEYNDASGSSLPPLKLEEVIACTLTELEYLVEDFMKSGAENFLSLYYKYWLHTNQQVTLSELKKEATVKGLDGYGFLIVETDDGKKLTLQPDGNRFDMMQNLIVSKEEL